MAYIGFSIGCWVFGYLVIRFQWSTDGIGVAAVLWVLATILVAGEAPEDERGLLWGIIAIMGLVPAGSYFVYRRKKAQKMHELTAFCEKCGSDDVINRNNSALCDDYLCKSCGYACPR
jgi:hypothetical protein